MTRVNCEVSRRTFLKGGGALIVGFSVLGSAVGARAAKAGANPYESDGPVDPQQIDSWVAIHADNTASIKLGMIELGQGSTTGLLTIAAEELNMAMSQMKMIANDTDVTPNQGFTAGSQAVAVGGKQTRAFTSDRLGSCERGTTGSSPVLPEAGLPRDREGPH